jgi:hypothetical protein
MPGYGGPLLATPTGHTPTPNGGDARLWRSLDRHAE